MSEELLRFIRNYNHDFQNHLQVISALAQLNRAERIREYIGQVSGQLREISKMAVVEPPELAAALLAFQQQVTRYRVPVRVDVRAAASGERLTQPGSGVPLRQAFRELGALMGFLEGSVEPVVLTVSNSAEQFVLEIDLPPTGDATAAALENSLGAVKGLLGQLGAWVGVVESGPVLGLRLEFPRREG